MTNTTRGVAWPLWARIKKECAIRGWNSLDLEEHAKVPRQTTANLEISTRSPQARIVNALADALNIDQYEAHQLAGLVPDDGYTIRSVIETSPMFNEPQRQALLDLVAQFETENQTGGQ